MTRGLVAALVVAAGALAPVAGPAATPACAAGSVAVSVIVDFSDVATTTATCVSAATRDTGATVLAARARALGRPAPRYSASGLLCAIDGYPAEGCGVRSDGAYAYWAYYLGHDGAWEYATGGPAGRRVSAASAEGWRWHPAGTGTASDPAPRATPDPTATCRPAPTTVPVTAAPTTVPATGPARTGPAPPATVSSDPPPTSTAATTSTTAPHSTVPLRPSAVSSRPPSAPPIAAGSSPAGGGIPNGAVGAALVVSLGTAGLIVSRRRRRP